jgi:hypothetical protein
MGQKIDASEPHGLQIIFEIAFHRFKRLIDEQELAQFHTLLVKPEQTPSSRLQPWRKNADVSSPQWNAFPAFVLKQGSDGFLMARMFLQKSSMDWPDCRRINA